MLPGPARATQLRGKQPGHDQNDARDSMNAHRRLTLLTRPTPDACVELSSIVSSSKPAGPSEAWSPTDWRAIRSAARTLDARPAAGSDRHESDISIRSTRFLPVLVVAASTDFAPCVQSSSTESMSSGPAFRLCFFGSSASTLRSSSPSVKDSSIAVKDLDVSFDGDSETSERVRRSWKAEVDAKRTVRAGSG